MIDYGYCQSEACWGDAYMTGDRVERVMQGIKAVGGSRVRIGVQVGSWADLDRAVNSATANGLKPLLCILGNETLQAGSQSNVTAYAALCKAIALRYGPAGTGQVSAIEIENEMNISTNPPFNASPAFYVQFLKAAYEAIKSVATSMTVISGGTIPSPTFAFFVTSINPVDWYTGVFAAGGGQYLDAVGFHWYFEQYPSNQAEAHWTYLADVRALMVANGIAAKQIWVSEVGVGYPGGPGVTTASQARDFLKILIDSIISRSYCGPFFVYQYANSYADPNNTPYGIVDYQFAPKPPIFEYAGSIRGTGTADVTRPSAPTGVMVSDVTENGAAATWNPATDDVGVTDYYVYLAGGGKLTDSLTTAVNLAGLLTPGTPYQLYVTALDAAGNESLPSALSAPFTTNAPSGSQAFDEGQFVGSTIPTSFAQLGLGFTVTGGVALPNQPATDKAVYTVAPFAVDKQTADHRMRVTLAGASAASDRSAMALVRTKPDGTEWVAALTTGGNNDSLKIMTCIAGKVRTRAAKNATPGTTGQYLELIASGNTYTANLIDTGSVIRATVDWPDTNGAFPGAMNRRTGIGWHHKRVHSANFVAPGISGWKASDLNAVQAVTGAVEPWMYAIVDPDDWAELTATGSWETLMAATQTPVSIGSGGGGGGGGPAPSSFVTRDPATGYLMLDGARFRFAGNNGEMAGLSESTTTYGETLTSGLHTMNHTAIDAFFSAAENMEAGVVRQFLLSMGTPDSLMPSITAGTTPVFNDPALDGFDYALSKCPAAGIKVIFTLVDDYDYYTGGRFDWCTLSGVTPDGNASQFFTNATVIANFKTFVSHMLNHVNTYTGVAYKDDPDILAWETGNEVAVTGATSDVLDWTANIADHIKNTVGAQQLVMDGKWGLLGPGGVIPTTHMNDPNIDIYTEHTYDQYRNPAHMANLATICHNYGKAFVVGEYPLAGASGWTNADMISTVEGNANVDGDLFWNMLPIGMTHGGGYVIHYPGDDGTMVTRVTAQANHAIAMAGSTLRAASAPAKAETLVGPEVDVSKWTSRSTANITGGQIILPTGDTAYSSAVKYDLTKSDIVVEMVTKNPGAGASACGMYVQPTPAPYASNTIGFVTVGNTMNFRHDVSGNSDTSETYNSTTHRWLRLRASADASYLTAYPAAIGTLYWDVSPDGVTWTNKRSYSGPAMVLSSIYVVLFNWNYGGDGSSGTAVFDNFNV